MNKLVFAAMLVGSLSLATGCIISSDDEVSANFDFSWTLSSQSNEGCGSATTARVTSELAGGEKFIDLYDCVAGGGLSAPLPLGDYTVWVDLLDASGNLYAQSFAGLANLDLEAEIVGVNFPVTTDAGYMSLSWTLEDNNDGSALSCLDAGVDDVSVLATVVGGAGTFTDDVFPCDMNSNSCADGSCLTGEIDLGMHTVVVAVLDSNGDSLGDSQPRTVNFTFGNQLEPLGNFNFQFQ